jgi:hypothetical protein
VLPGDISLGYTPSGKRRRKTVYGPTVADVQDKFKKLRAELENGVEASVKYTVRDAVRDWLSRGLIGRDAGTVEKNRILAETHVIPHLGAVKLRELTADHVDDWLADRKKVLATRSLKDAHAVLRRAIKHAQRRNKVLRTSPNWWTFPKAAPVDRARQCRWNAQSPHPAPAVGGHSRTCGPAGLSARRTSAASGQGLRNG